LHKVIKKISYLLLGLDSKMLYLEALGTSFHYLKDVENTTQEK
jgi:hypothetical protein